MIRVRQASHRGLELELGWGRTPCGGRGEEDMVRRARWGELEDTVSEDNMMGRPRWGEDTMRRERWREHNGERPRCGEVDTMGGSHNWGGHDDEASRGAYARGGDPPRRE